MMTNDEDEVMAQAAEAMAREIDREILWSMLAELGWIRIMLPSLLDMKNAVDIQDWLVLNCNKGYQHSGRDFIFEDERDANWFKLRWLS